MGTEAKPLSVHEQRQKTAAENNHVMVWTRKGIVEGNKKSAFRCSLCNLSLRSAGMLIPCAPHGVRRR